MVKKGRDAYRERENPKRETVQRKGIKRECTKRRDKER
jgi:hypothetical protein